jgi:hypothetical protein
MTREDVEKCRDSLWSVLNYVDGTPGARPYTVGDLKRVLDYAKVCLDKKFDPWNDSGEPTMN